MINNIFNKIIKREIPAYIIYEDDLCIAFLDIMPKNPGHTLIVPKKQNLNLFLEDNKTIGHLFFVAKKLSFILETKLKATGFKLLTNINKSAGQEVAHTHLHLVPYYDDNKLANKNPEKIYGLIIN